MSCFIIVAVAECDRLDSIPNSMMLNEKDGYLIGESVLYICNDGYDLIGSSTRTCTRGAAGGMFSGVAPICRGRFCFSSQFS